MSFPALHILDLYLKFETKSLKEDVYKVITKGQGVLDLVLG